MVGCIFYGLGADGTVGANKNSIKIIGEETAGYAQGFFVYDSKKSGSTHDVAPPLRAHADPLDVPRPAGPVHRLPSVPVRRALDMLRRGGRRRGVPAQQSRSARTRSGTQLPRAVQEELIRKQHPVLRDRRRPGGGRSRAWRGRINTIMQTCFFAISGVLPRDEAIAKIKEAIEATYGRKGRSWSRRTSRPSTGRSRTCMKSSCRPPSTSTREPLPIVPPDAPEFVQQVTAVMIAGRGDDAAGQRAARRRHLSRRDVAVGEAQHLGLVPVWKPDICIQCGNCVDGLPARGDPRALYDDRHWLAAPRTASPSAPLPAAASRACASRSRCRRRLHRLRVVRRGLPGTEPGGRRYPRHQHGRESAAARARVRATWTFFERCPTTGRPASMRRSFAGSST